MEKIREMHEHLELVLKQKGFHMEKSEEPELDLELFEKRENGIENLKILEWSAQQTQLIL